VQCCFGSEFCSTIWQFRSTTVSRFQILVSRLSFNLCLATGGLQALFIISSIVMILICLVGFLAACRVCHPVCTLVECVVLFVVS
jgi:hypothetical protein